MASFTTVPFARVTCFGAVTAVMLNVVPFPIVAIVPISCPVVLPRYMYFPTMSPVRAGDTGPGVSVELWPTTTVLEVELLNVPGCWNTLIAALIVGPELTPIGEEELSVATPTVWSALSYQ